MKTATLSLAMSALFALASAAGCNSAAPDEDVKSVRDAICSGGGGGGDACTGSDWCPPECSICFQSVQQRVELQNMWECQPDPGGGGGGGGQCTRSPTQIEAQEGGWVPLGWSGQEYCGQAESKATQFCMWGATDQCMPQAVNGGLVEFGCGDLGSNGLRYCYCQWRVTCTYSSR